MRLPALRRPRADMLCLNACERAAKPLFDLGKKSIKIAILRSVTVEHIFQSCLGTVGAVSLGDEDPHNGIGNIDCL